MSDKMSETDARELLRVIHEDQGSRSPAFNREFALRIINAVSSWFEPSSYHGTLWLERWEEPKVIEEAPPAPAPTHDPDDDIPF